MLSKRYGLDPVSEIQKKLIPDPGVKKAPDPGSAILHVTSERYSTRFS
jgi:hypothetical protein